MTGRVWSLHYDSAEIPLVNATRNGHWAPRHAMTKEWRGAFAQLARAARIPRLERCRIVVNHAHDKPGRLPDPGACFEAVKAAIDGLKDGGVFVDDDGSHVLSVTYMAPKRMVSLNGRPPRFGRIILTIEEIG